MRVINLANLQQFTAVNLSSDPGEIGGPVQIPQAAQFSILWGLDDGKFGHSVFYGRYNGGFAGTAAQVNAILAALTTGGTWTALAAFLSTTSGLSGLSVRDVNTINQPVIPNTTGGAPGTSASPALPCETALALTFRTAKTGPQNRGRMFVPGWATNALGAGNVASAAAVTALQNWGQVLSTALAAQGYTFVIGQRARAAYTGATGTDHPARAATTTQITTISVRDNHWDSQRRRGLR